MLTHLIPACFLERHKQFESVEILRKLCFFLCQYRENGHTHTRKSRMSYTRKHTNAVGPIIHTEAGPISSSVCNGIVFPALAPEIT